MYPMSRGVLKIYDRHDSAILATRDGRVLRIDYGYILGDVMRPFTGDAMAEPDEVMPNQQSHLER
jgi:hypothetical protein